MKTLPALLILLLPAVAVAAPPSEPVAYADMDLSSFIHWNIRSLPPPTPTPVPDDDDEVWKPLTDQDLPTRGVFPAEAVDGRFAWPRAPRLAAYTDLGEGWAIGLFVAQAGDERGLDGKFVTVDVDDTLAYAHAAAPDEPFGLLPVAADPRNRRAAVFLALLEPGRLQRLLGDTESCLPGARRPARLPADPTRAGYQWRAADATVYFGYRDGEILLGVVR